MDILFNLKSCSENKLTPNYDIDGCIVNIFCRELRSKLENEFFFSFLHLKPIWEALPRCLISFSCRTLTASLGELCSDEMGTFLVSTPWQLWKLFRFYHDGYSLPKMMDGQHLKKDDMKFEKWYECWWTDIFFLRKVDMSLKYSMEDCSIIFLSRKKSVAVLY